MTKVTGNEWSRDMVAKLEAGEKTFTVDILLAVATAQRLPYEWYLAGTALESEMIEATPE
jgi:hypothetical protein